MSFSDRLRQARKRQGLTQEELGKKSGLSTYTIQRYEYGKLNPKKDTVAKLATALNLGYDYTKSGEPYFYTFVDTVPSPEYEDAEDFNQEQYRNAIEKALEDVTSSTIGEKIKGIRKEKGLTQKELAKQTGLSLDSIQGYEQNKYKPRFEQLKKITTALHCNAGELLDNRLTMMITSPISVKDGVLFLENSYFDSKFGTGDIYNLLDDIHKKKFLEAISKQCGEEIKEVKFSPTRFSPIRLMGPSTEKVSKQDMVSKKINNNLKKLNKQGQEKLYNYSCDLLKIPEYRTDTPPDQEETVPDEALSPNQKEPDKN